MQAKASLRGGIRGGRGLVVVGGKAEGGRECLIGYRTRRVNFWAFYYKFIGFSVRYVGAMSEKIVVS